MKVKLIVEFTMDHMPDIKECEQICAGQGFLLSGTDAVKQLAIEAVESEGIIGVADFERVLEVYKIEQANDF